MKKNNEIKNTLPSFKTLDSVIGEASVSRSFQEAYSEELLRLRLAVQIRGLRLQSQLTQSDLARESGMTQSVIARIESGKHTISLSTLNKIAQALGREISLGARLGGTITHQVPTRASIESPYILEKNQVINTITAVISPFK